MKVRPCAIDNYNILSNTVLLVEEGLGVAVCLNGALAIHHSPQLRFVPLVPGTLHPGRADLEEKPCVQPRHFPVCADGAAVWGKRKILAV